MEREGQQEQTQVQAQPTMSDCPMLKRRLPSWVQLFLLGLMLSFLHSVMVFLFFIVLLQPGELPGSGCVAVATLLNMLPLLLLNYLGVETDVTTPAGLVFGISNSLLYGFIFALIIHWLNRWRMRRR
jgi:hypothetical protein